MHSTETFDANCLVKDLKGWWVCLLDEEGDVVTCLGPYATVTDAERNMSGVPA